VAAQPRRGGSASDSRNGSRQNGLAQHDVPERSSAQRASAPHRSANNGPAENGSAKNGSAKNGSAKNGRLSRYSAFALLRHGLRPSTPWPKTWRQHPLRDSYDVVIIGGGVHGLATAYYLAANHGISNVAVLDKGYLGGGGSGRNTAILRSNYLTPEGVRFYDRSLELYRSLAAELNYNVMFSRRGHLTLAHNDSSLRTMAWRAEVNKLQGVDSSVIGPDEIKKLVPFLDTSSSTRYPILGALYHPPGGIIRHDAVVWGYARAADALGVHLHQQTEVTGVDVTNGRVTGVHTNRGQIATGAVLNATAGWSTLISDMAGVRMPVQTSPLQAAVTEPVRPFLDAVVVSGTLHVYVSQTDRGELVFGASVDPFTSYSMRGSLDFVEGLAGHVLELMPALSKLRLLRQWAGLCDMTPDYSPIMGPTSVDGFYVDVGWGTYGFKAGPVSGETMAETIATGRPAELIRAFGLDRFERGELVGEKGAAAVGH
jgi:sarcosine oxidase subunit beta